MSAFGAVRAAAALSPGSASVAECRARRSSGTWTCAARSTAVGVVGGAAGPLRPRNFSRRGAVVTRAVSDGEAVDKGVSSLQNLGLDDIGVNVDELSRCVFFVVARVSLTPPLQCMQ